MNRKLTESLQSAFENNRNQENAVHMETYMRGQFPFIGVKSKERRKLSKTFIRELPFDENIDSVMKCLWEKTEREFQYVVVDYLVKNKRHLINRHINLLEYLITTKSWWDTVDAIASHLVGTVFQRYPELIDSHGTRWLQSDNIWLNRTMIIFQLKYKDRTYEKLLFSIIKQLKNKDEFFIQKAIGWALREYSKTNPKSVLTFIKSQDLSNLAKREGMKRIYNN